MENWAFAIEQLVYKDVFYLHLMDTWAFAIEAIARTEMPINEIYGQVC